MDGFDIESLDEVIHGRVRLGVMAYLTASNDAGFGQLKAALGVTDGNLSVHLTKLEEAGYVTIDKRFEGKKPLTTVRITPQGRAAFARYLEAIQALVGQVGTSQA